jgi:hypothetical protein
LILSEAVCSGLFFEPCLLRLRIALAKQGRQAHKKHKIA